MNLCKSLILPWRRETDTGGMDRSSMVSRAGMADMVGKMEKAGKPDLQTSSSRLFKRLRPIFFFVQFLL
jgi:hypothetical protein